MIAKAHRHGLIAVAPIVPRGAIRTTFARRSSLMGVGALLAFRVGIATRPLGTRFPCGLHLPHRAGLLRRRGFLHRTRLTRAPGLGLGFAFPRRLIGGGATAAPAGGAATTAAATTAVRRLERHGVHAGNLNARNL